MTFTLDESSKNPIPLRWKGKDKNHHEHESAKKVIIYYEKLTDSGIDANTLKQIVFLTQRH